ncbi:hypothetical protein SAMN05216573_12738 [Bradyrhizobium sp. Rc3b]|uniref:hypothetical protein n=1 Tax=Bradyrhizobium sp. Rc3b TaxID=1855322 RepID=UPI0008E94406|nr:hypothetical protein [Bradyrhizobium sp. Rc3b]SFN92712.1 hypothetical protein SAMN05216573_12738 [Bradyrhizobium sp. Rc3b]
MQSAITPIDVSQFLHLYDRPASEKSIKLSIGFNFHEYVAITRTLPTKGPTYPIFRPDRSPIRLGEGYWIIGVDDNNMVALVEAARLYDLSQSNLAEHLESLKFFYADPARHAHPSDRCICRAPTAKKITGKVVFHGDIWVRKDFRGQGLPKIMGRIARCVSFALWAPDFSVGLAGRWSVDKGVYDPQHCEPGGSILRLQEDNLVDDDWLLWRTGEELKTLVHRDRGELSVVAGLLPPHSSGT